MIYLRRRLTKRSRRVVFEVFEVNQAGPDELKATIRPGDDRNLDTLEERIGRAVLAYNRAEVASANRRSPVCG